MIESREPDYRESCNPTSSSRCADAEIRNEASASSEAVDVDQLLDKLSLARLSVVILDACRNNPLARVGNGKSLPKGLAQMQSAAGTFIAFATGNVIYDSLLTSVADEHEMDTVSARGFAWGVASAAAVIALTKVICCSSEATPTSAGYCAASCTASRIEISAMPLRIKR